MELPFGINVKLLLRLFMHYEIDLVDMVKLVTRVLRQDSIDIP
jgi:hypothetical protein